MPTVLSLLSSPLVLKQTVDSVLPVGRYFFTEMEFSAWVVLGLHGCVPAPRVKLFPSVLWGVSAQRLVP